MVSNIRKIWRLPDVPSDDTYVRLMQKLSAFTPKYKPASPDTYFGIEVEIEHVPSTEKIGLKSINGANHYIWNNVEDGSLRNNGREFVSIPLRHENVEFALSLLKDTLSKNPHTKGYEFTDRTSVHVHMNAQDMTPEQIMIFLLTYVTMEPLLYKFCSGNRHKNIFCVPVNQSYQHAKRMYNLFYANGADINYDLVELVQSWKKYMGLNLLPLQDRGTIEFRHMIGTLDLDKLNTWVNLISQLKQFSMNANFEYVHEVVSQLNTTSHYMQFIREVFPASPEVLLHSNIQKQMEQMVLFLKSCLCSNHDDVVLKYLSAVQQDPPILALAFKFNDLKKITEKEKALKRDVQNAVFDLDAILRHQVILDNGAVLVAPEEEREEDDNQF